MNRKTPGQIIRQYEILLQANKNKNTFDLADEHSVDVVTIQRDLKQLRKKGYKIKSVGGKTVELIQKIDTEFIQKLINELKL